jgi:hypothetical protein
MTPDDPKSAVDEARAAGATPRDLAGHDMSLLGGDVEGVRTPWRWAATAIVALVAAAEIAWFFGRAGGSEAVRRQTVAALSPSDQAALAAKFERFQKLDPPEQERLRKLHGAIEADADPEALRKTLAKYESWNAQLPPQVSARLVGVPSDERATKVAAIVAEGREAAAKSFGDADSKVLVAWLEKQVRGHQDEMMAQLPQTMRERLDHMNSRERTWSLMLFALTTRGPNGSPFQKLSAVELAELRSELSATAQAQWNAASGNPEDFKLLLAGWVRQSMERHMAREASPGTRITDAQLMEFFDRELTEEHRTRLVALPREEMMSQLRREYYRQKGLWREGYWRPDGRRPGGDDRKPGGPNDAGPNDGRPGGGMGGPRPFGRQPGGFGPGPRPGGGFGPGGGNPSGSNPGGFPPGGQNPGGPNPGPPRPNNDGNPPPPPKPQT